MPFDGVQEAEAWLMQELRAWHGLQPADFQSGGAWEDFAEDFHRFTSEVGLRRPELMRHARRLAHAGCYDAVPEPAVRQRLWRDALIWVLFRRVWVWRGNTDSRWIRGLRSCGEEWEIVEAIGRADRLIEGRRLRNRVAQLLAGGTESEKKRMREAIKRRDTITLSRLLAGRVCDDGFDFEAGGSPFPPQNVAAWARGIAADQIRAIRKGRAPAVVAEPPESGAPPGPEWPEVVVARFARLWTMADRRDATARRRVAQVLERIRHAFFRAEAGSGASRTFAYRARLDLQVRQSTTTGYGLTAVVSQAPTASPYWSAMPPRAPDDRDLDRLDPLLGTLRAELGRAVGTVALPSAVADAVAAVVIQGGQAEAQVRCLRAHHGASSSEEAMMWLCDGGYALGRNASQRRDPGDGEPPCGHGPERADALRQHTRSGSPVLTLAVSDCEDCDRWVAAIEQELRADEAWVARVAEEDAVAMARWRWLGLGAVAVGAAATALALATVWTHAPVEHYRAHVEPIVLRDGIPPDCPAVTRAAVVSAVDDALSATGWACSTSLDSLMCSRFGTEVTRIVVDAQGERLSVDVYDTEVAIGPTVAEALAGVPLCRVTTD